MHPLQACYRIVEWLSANGASHATALLFIITAIYVVLTGRMTRAMARQTRAMIQPVLSLKISWSQIVGEREPASAGQVIIENQGNQPAVLLDVHLQCVVDRRPFDDTFGGLDENIIVPQSSAGVWFDFGERWKNAKARPEMGAGWALHVVAADIGRGVVLEYVYWPVLNLRICRVRYPIRVRIKYLRRSIKIAYLQFRRFIRAG